MDATERLQDHVAIEQAAEDFSPAVCAEDDVAVDPHHFFAVVGQCPQRHVQQAFFLPHDVAAAHLNQYVRVIFLELETRTIGQFHCDEWDAQSLTKYLVVREPASVCHRVEVGGDGPEVSGVSVGIEVDRAHVPVTFPGGCR